jgi:hypothetical protein
MPFQSHEVYRRRPVFSKHYNKFSRQKLCCEDEVPYETDVKVSLGMRTIFGWSNISKIDTKSNFNLFIFAFHILFDPSTIATQQSLPAKHFKINKNIKYEVLFHNL